MFSKSDLPKKIRAEEKVLWYIWCTVSKRTKGGKNGRWGEGTVDQYDGVPLGCPKDRWWLQSGHNSVHSCYWV